MTTGTARFSVFTIYLPLSSQTAYASTLSLLVPPRHSQLPSETMMLFLMNKLALLVHGTHLFLLQFLQALFCLSDSDYLSFMISFHSKKQCTATNSLHLRHSGDFADIEYHQDKKKSQHIHDKLLIHASNSLII